MQQALGPGLGFISGNPPNDVRSHIFQAWIERDNLRAAEAAKLAEKAALDAEWESSVSGSTPVYIDITTADPVIGDDPLGGDPLTEDPVVGDDPVVIPITPEEQIADCAGFVREILNIEDDNEARTNLGYIWSVVEAVGQELGEAGANIIHEVIDRLTAGKQMRLMRLFPQGGNWGFSAG